MKRVDLSTPIWIALGSGLIMVAGAFLMGKLWVIYTGLGLGIILIILWAIWAANKTKKS